MPIPYTLQEHQSKKLFPQGIKIQEFVGSMKPIATQESKRVLTESAKGKGKKKLIVQMEAIHVGRTGNYTFYTDEGLRSGLESWTYPYNKPVLTHHNDYSGEAIGRILKAEFHEMTKHGKAGLVFTCEITDPEAQEKVIDGRYQTVSIGATTDKVTCNICGTNRIEEWCEHWPGDTYGDGADQQTCHFIIGTTFGREVSYVNVPADQFAGNTSVQTVEDEGGSTQESIQMEVFQIAEGLFQNVKTPEVNLFEHLDPNYKETLQKILTFEEGRGSQMNGTNPAPGVVIPPIAAPVVPVQEGQQHPATPPVEPQATPPAGQQEGQQTPPTTGEPAPAGQQEGQQTPPAGQEPPATPPVAPVQEGQQGTKPFDQLTESEKVGFLQGQLNEANSTIAGLVKENQKLTARNQELEGESDNLVSENARLNGEVHKALAEKVVSFKLALRKADVIGITQEEALKQHIARTKESLNDSLKELELEYSNVRPVAGSVKNPGSPEEGQEEKKYSLAEAEDLMKNMFGSKNRK